MWTSSIRSVWRFLRDEQGPTAVEYAIMLALIIVVVVFSVSAIGDNVDETMEMVTSAFTGS